MSSGAPDSPGDDLPVSLDMQLLGDNIGEVARYTIEKHEFAHEITLPEQLRSEVTVQIRDELWKMTEDLIRQRNTLLERFYAKAENILKEAVDRQA